MHAGNDAVGFQHEIAARRRRQLGGVINKTQGAGMGRDRAQIARDQAFLGRFRCVWHRSVHRRIVLLIYQCRNAKGNAVEPFDLYSPVIDADPFPYYAELRENYPCYWSENAQLWILSRYDDIVEAARDWETFSSTQGNLIDELPGRAGATLGTTDPPRHDRLRALSQAAFLKRNLDRLIEPTVEIADRALDRIVEQGTFEFVNDFSSQITVKLLFRTMGLPERDHAEIRRKVILAVSTDKSVKGRTAEHIAAFKDMSEFLTAEVAARRIRPTDDLITHLAEAEIDGDRLSEREVVLTTATFVMAGVELLSSFMSVFALNLHDYPDARRRLVADPSLIAPAIEESLRFNTSAQRFKRVATRQDRATRRNDESG